MRPQVPAVGRVDARRGQRHRAAAVPGLLRPVHLEVVDRAERGVPEVGGEALQDRLATSVVRLARPLAQVVAADEREQHARAAVRRRVVERQVGGALGAHRRARQPLLAPERLAVDRLGLHQRAVRQALEQLVAVRRAAAVRSGCGAASAGGTATITRLAWTVELVGDHRHAAGGLRRSTAPGCRAARAAAGAPCAARSAASRRGSGPAARPPRVLISRSKLPGFDSLPAAAM